MIYNKLELHDKEIFGPNLIVVEKNGTFQFEFVGSRKKIRINKDSAHKLRRWITERLVDATASQAQSSFGSNFDKCRGKS